VRRIVKTPDDLSANSQLFSMSLRGRRDVDAKCHDD
jgi:hypothetical protein